MKLVHGTAQSPAGWARMTEHLTTFGHEVDAVDLVSVDADEPAAAYGDAASRQLRAGDGASGLTRPTSPGQ